MQKDTYVTQLPPEEEKKIDAGRLPNRRGRQEEEPKKTTGGRNRERRVSRKRRRTIRGRGLKLGGEEGEESQE